MFQDSCVIVRNKRVAPGHYILELESPRIARLARPGQFVQILCSRGDAVGAYRDTPLLPRPFSFLDAAGGKIAVLYRVVGAGTKILARVRPGKRLQICGPFGNGFTLGRRSKVEGGVKRIILVGGGVGIPPLFHLAKVMIQNKIQKSSEITVVLGARSKALLLCEKEFNKLNVDLRVATDDGSKGRKGFVTELLEDVLFDVRAGLAPAPIGRPQGSPLHKPVYIYTCGPTPMMRSVSSIAQKFEVPCEVSVEVPMACGFGACLGCALPVKSPGEPGGRRFAVACCEGPVFEGSEILWD